MARSAMPALPGPEFDAFLFAPIDREGKDVLLSVLSALAQLNAIPGGRPRNWRTGRAGRKSTVDVVDCSVPQGSGPIDCLRRHDGL